MLAGDGVAAGAVAAPVSARRVHDTVLAWAGAAAAAPLPTTAGGDAGEEGGSNETVLGEAMTPYLAYGWQPQAMAVRGRWKAIRAGAVEVYDVVADPAETRDLAGSVQVPREQLTALRDYPLPGAAAAPVDDETRRRLASLGYTAAGGARPVREGAPRPAAMTHLFADLDRATALFSAGRHAEALPVLAALAERDPGNPLVAVQAAVSHSLLGHPEEALRWFERARRIDPGSPELQHALGLHHCRREEWQQAEPLLLATVAREPGRLPAVECLARLREAGGRPLEAAELLERLAAASRDPSPQLLRAGDLRMSAGDTAGAIAAFERALAAAGDGFDRHLELGVLYLAARRLPEARTALDAALVAEPGEPMALFKRAQVSVLLGEPDARARVRAAEAAADATTAPMIARERLFAGLR